MFKRLRALVIKEFIQMRRDRLTLAMMLLLPLVQLAVFGFAINTDVKHVPMVVIDRSLSRQSRELIQAFTNSEYFDLVATVDKEAELADHFAVSRPTVREALKRLAAQSLIRTARGAFGGADTITAPLASLQL